MILAVGAPVAHADSYTAEFMCTGTCASVPTESSPVTFPAPDFPALSFFDVFVDIQLPGLSDAPGNSYTWTFYPAVPGSGILVITDTTTGDSENVDPVTGLPMNANSMETGTLTFVATPEPGSAALMLLGVGLVFLMRKPLGLPLPQAT